MFSGPRRTCEPSRTHAKETAKEPVARRRVPRRLDAPTSETQRVTREDAPLASRPYSAMSYTPSYACCTSRHEDSGSRRIARNLFLLRVEVIERSGAPASPTPSVPPTRALPSPRPRPAVLGGGRSHTTADKLPSEPAHIDLRADGPRIRPYSVGRDAVEDAGSEHRCGVSVILPSSSYCIVTRNACSPMPNFPFYGVYVSGEGAARPGPQLIRARHGRKQRKNSNLEEREKGVYVL